MSNWQDLHVEVKKQKQNLSLKLNALHWNHLLWLYVLPFFITIYPVCANLLHLQTDIVKKNKVLTGKTILNYVTCQKYMYMYTDSQVLSFFPEVIVILILLPCTECVSIC